MIYYVDCNAVNAGTGTKDDPFKRISDAAKAALAGDEVVVMPGVYREDVDPINAGTQRKRMPNPWS